MFDGLKVMFKNGCFRWLVTAFMISSLGIAVLMPLKAFYAISVLGANQNEIPILMFFGTIAGLAGIPFWVVVSKRYGKHRAWSGENRAAMFFSAWSIATKAAGSLGGSLGLWALAWIGFDAGREALNAPEAIAGLKYVYVFLPSSIFLLAGAVICKYPMTRERQTRIRAAIERRDGHGWRR